MAGQEPIIPVEQADSPWISLRDSISKDYPTGSLAAEITDIKWMAYHFVTSCPRLDTDAFDRVHRAPIIRFIKKDDREITDHDLKDIKAQL